VVQICFLIGSIYFTSDILAATDWLQLLCRQLKIRPHGMTQYKDKVTLSGKRCPDCDVMVRCYDCFANGFQFDSRLADFPFVFFFFAFF